MCAADQCVILSVATGGTESHGDACTLCLAANPSSHEESGAVAAQPSEASESDASWACSVCTCDVMCRVTTP